MNTTTMRFLQRLVRSSVLLALLGCLMTAAAPYATAAVLLPGSTILATPGPGPVGGVVVAGGVPVPFAALTYAGTLTSTVIAGDVSNPLGGLTFTYELTNLVGSPGEIDRLTVNSFAGFLTDGNYQAPPVGTIPTLNDRSASGDVIGFSFIGAPIGLGTLVPGATSALLVIQTNAPLFSPTFASVIDGSVTSVASFAPFPVPEPSTLAMAAIGLVGLWVARRSSPRGRR